MIDSATLGCKLVASGNVVESFSCADLCWTLVDCVQAVGEGIYDGISNVATMVRHPIDAAGNIVHGSVTIMCQISKTLYTLGVIGSNYCINPEIGKQQWKEYCNNISQTCDAISDQLNNVTAHDAIRCATAFAIETILMTKLLSSAHKVCRAAKGNIIELIKSIESTEVVMVTAEGIPIKIATKSNTASKTKNVSLMEGSGKGSVARMTQKVNNMNELFELPFWKNIKKYCERTGKSHHGQQIYKVKKDIDNLNLFKEDYFFINALHKNQIEVYNKKNVLRFVCDLCGVIDQKLSKKKFLRIGPLAG